MDMNTGLDNLGNTCYMNATIQMLSTVPEFSKALQKFVCAIKYLNINL